MNVAIGVFDAKTKLSELLQNVKQGQRYTITLRGEPVADLIPCEKPSSLSAQAAVEALRNMPKIKGVSNKMIAELIKEGRK